MIKVGDKVKRNRAFPSPLLSLDKIYVVTRVERHNGVDAIYLNGNNTHWYASRFDLCKRSNKFIEFQKRVTGGSDV